MPYLKIQNFRTLINTQHLKNQSPQVLINYNGTEVGQWSSCFVNDNAECGTGIQYKALGCLDASGAPLPNEFCSLITSQVSRACSIECGQQASVVAEWSQWSPCSNSCGAGTQTRVKRDIGEKKDFRSCYNQCTLYQWTLGQWSACKVDTCGAVNGVQTRAVRCVDSRDARQTMSLNVAECESHSSLTYADLSIRNCSIACGESCAMDAWSEWDECDADCVGFRARSRLLIRGSETQNCSDLVSRQTEPCSIGVNCALIRLNWEPWSSCQFTSEDQCGSGYEMRRANCYRGTNLTATSACQLTQPVETRARTVECDEDCVVSEWTVWSSCDATCGVANRSRYRRVLNQPVRNGKSCPNVTAQSKPCDYLPCARWFAENWLACAPHFGSCGVGIQLEMSNLRKINVQVSLEKWRVLMIQKLFALFLTINFNSILEQIIISKMPNSALNTATYHARRRNQFNWQIDAYVRHRRARSMITFRWMNENALVAFHAKVKHHCYHGRHGVCVSQTHVGRRSMYDPVNSIGIGPSTYLTRSATF